MSNYSSFIGIDIGKSEVIVGKYGTKSTTSFSNSKTGIKKFLKTYKAELSKAFVVLKTTGEYETLFLNALLDKDIAVHRANTRQVKSFIRSLGTLAKSDALDAQALALYGYERHHRLALLDLFRNSSSPPLCCHPELVSGSLLDAETSSSHDSFRRA